MHDDVGGDEHGLGLGGPGQARHEHGAGGLCDRQDVTLVCRVHRVAHQHHFDPLAQAFGESRHRFDEMVLTLVRIEGCQL